MKTSIKLYCHSYGFAWVETEYAVNPVGSSEAHTIGKMNRVDGDKLIPLNREDHIFVNGGLKEICKMVMNATLGQNARREPGFEEPKETSKNPFRKKKKPKPQSTDETAELPI